MHFVNQAGLELTDIHLVLSPDSGIKGMCHQQPALIFYVSLFMHVGTCVPQYACLDQITHLQESIFSFYYMVPGDQTQILKLGSKSPRTSIFFMTVIN